jgi:N-acetylglutamate synthase
MSPRAAAQIKSPCAGRIRPFRIADYDEVMKLWRRTEGVGLNESDARPAIAAFLQRNPRLSLVAVKAGRIIGAILCGHDGRRGYLHHLAVARRYRQQGLGRQLVEACLAKLRAKHIHKCNIFVFAGHVAGMGFWKHNGWKLRSDLSVMQIQLSAGSDASPGCAC